MAEFRRVGGNLVSHRQPGGRRVLLPAEAELCNSLGLSEDEYWYFVDLTQAYTAERAKEYELVPEVHNGATAIAIVSLVIGLASTAASYLLAPKPSAAKTPPSLTTAEVKGATKFAPQTNFDAVQELSSLGSVIPLIFTRKGVRVNSTLLWSQMLSLGTGQQLLALFLFGSRIEFYPDYASFAIGDSLLENYNNAKVAAYFMPHGGRPQEPTHRYTEGTAENVPYTDAFSIFWDRDDTYQPYFSGVRTPSTQTQFGAYSPMPNGTGFKLPYELVLIPKDTENSIKNDLKDKQEKLNRVWFHRASLIGLDDTGAQYYIEAGEEDPNDYDPWGLSDVNAISQSVRESADAACAIGELYMVGERFAVGKSLSTSEPWSTSVPKSFTLKWSDETPYREVDAHPQGNNLAPYQTMIVQRAAVAVVSNNRDCDVTEIGLKSTVWKQITSFPNVNSVPDDDTIEEYEDKSGSITIGGMSKYIRRLSFFRIFVRALGSDAEWLDINGGTLFAVEGSTPQPQYNYVRFLHSYGQHEFKFVPVPGAMAHRAFTDRDIWLLRPGTRASITYGDYTVVFSGFLYTLTATNQCNSEWYIGTPPPSESFTGNNNLNPYDVIADIPFYDAERISHMDGPEHEVVYVCEQLQQTAPQYEDMAIAGLRINSSTEWTSFSSLSAFITLGTTVSRLVNSNTEATNLLPEIAYALLTDTLIGAGSLIGESQVDRDRMATAAYFCEANGFTWDGVISERINLREWIFEQAGYCLLDFTILGGRFSLVPSVPYNSDYTIKYDGLPEIKALFTDGNIRRMKVTWLSPEERRLFRATCLWRQDTYNGFPETKVLTVRLSNAEGGSENDTEEVFDMSGWCTSEEHAYTFARYALKLRQLVDHSITFETTPQAAMNLAPGEYFRLVSEVTHTSRFNNGSIGPDGLIQSVDKLNGTYDILYWQPGTVGVLATTLYATDGRTSQTSLFGTVFTLSNTTTVNRVYKVETLSYAEDGLVEIAASYVPLTDSGSLAILDWSEDMFVTEAG